MNLFTAKMNKTTENSFCLPCDVDSTKRPLNSYVEFKFIRGNRTLVPPSWSTGWRMMPFHLCTMGFRKPGCCSTLEVGDREPLVVQEDNFLFVPAGIPHRFTEDEHGMRESLWIHFLVTFNGEINLFSLFDIEPFYVSDPKMVARFAALLTEIVSIPQYAGICDSVRFQVTGMALVNELLAFAKPKVFPKNHDENIQRLQKALSLLHTSQKMPTTQTLAQLSHLSSSRFLAVFHEVIGVSPGHYWEQMRYERACKLLLLGNRSISEISEQLGYSDAFHFSRKFKKHAGLCPSEYRKCHLAQ